MPWSRLVDLELTDNEKIDACLPMPCDRPDYPYGLRICLTNRELEKLGLDADCDIDDLIDMRCFGIVTSVSKNPGPDGETQNRVEIQIQKIALQDEMTEETPDR